MRVESDRQGHHSSETPACHRCGVPLLADTTFCPYCERWLDEGSGRGARRRSDGEDGVFFALVAAACVAAALII